jgi:hypothetical protein
MKKIFLLLTCITTFLSISAQDDLIANTLKAFPYQKAADAESALSGMDQWKKDNWVSFFQTLDQEKTFTPASYALSAYVNRATQNPAQQKRIAHEISTALPSIQNAAGKKLLLKQLSNLGDPRSISAISPLLQDATFCNDAALTIATIGGNEAVKTLKKAMKTAGASQQAAIQSALDYLANPAPTNPTANPVVQKSVINPAQQLLQLQNEMEKASNPVEQKQILSSAEKIKGIGAMAFVGKYLSNPALQTQAAGIVVRQSLADLSLQGPMVKNLVEEARSKLQGEDSAVLMKLSDARLKEMSEEHGFVSLFNGKDLTGWKGLVGNPISRGKMTDEALNTAQAKANESIGKDWVVKDGLLIFTGHGDNLASEKKYGNIELYVDWKITEKGDAGIYLRGSPQVQVWDTSRREVGAQVGSGGLYNNTVNPSKPSSVADNPIGTWNTFRIIMKGEKVTVYLNGVKVTDEVTLENYWDRKQPIFPTEQIELQAHGTYVAYRNIYLRELPDEKTLITPQEQADGFLPVFNGKDLTGWTGNLAGYQAENGAIVVHPEKSSGNLYTENTYGDFVLRFDFQLTPGANNGIGIRTPLTGDAAYVGMEIQVLDNEHPKYSQLQPYQYHGSVYGVIPARRGFLLPTGEWNREEISIKGNQIKVTLNGTVITEGDLAESSKNGTMDHKEHPGLLRTEGHIGFLGHGDVVHFKNIRIKKL